MKKTVALLISLFFTTTAHTRGMSKYADMCEALADQVTAIHNAKKTGIPKEMLIYEMKKLIPEDSKQLSRTLKAIEEGYANEDRFYLYVQRKIISCYIYPQQYID